MGSGGGLSGGRLWADGMGSPDSNSSGGAVACDGGAADSARLVIE